MVQLGSSLLGGLLEVVDLVGHGGLELVDLAAGLVDRLADLELLVDLGGEACCNTQEQHSASWRGGTHVHAQCGHVHVHVHVVHVGGVRDMHILRMQFTGTCYASVCSCDCALLVL